MPPRVLAYLRVTAVGSPIQVGERVERGKWRLELMVGECMRLYAGMVRGRAAHFGMDGERDAIWLEDCPPGEATLRRALLSLAERSRQVEGSP